LPAGLGRSAFRFSALRHLDQVLSEALRVDEQQRLRRLTMTHALMALLADPQELDQALRQAAARLAELDF
jgi:hypothetical protein